MVRNINRSLTLFREGTVQEYNEPEAKVHPYQKALGTVMAAGTKVTLGGRRRGIDDRESSMVERF